MVTENVEGSKQDALLGTRVWCIMVWLNVKDEYLYTGAAG